MSFMRFAISAAFLGVGAFGGFEIVTSSPNTEDFASSWPTVQGPAKGPLKPEYLGKSALWKPQATTPFAARPFSIQARPFPTLAETNHNMAEGVFRFAHRMNRLEKVMAPKVNPAWAAAISPASGAGTGCIDCEKRAESLRYMDCSAKNGYLENQLQKERQNNTLLGRLMDINPAAKKFSDRETMTLDPRCIRGAMEARFSENSRSFRQCGSDGRRASVRSNRPCISENYFRLVNNSFGMVSRCLLGMNGESPIQQREDLRMMYGLTSIESGFHVNAMSGTGAGGVGQFTGVAIDAVNRNMMNSVRNQFAREGGECATIGNHLLRDGAPMRSSTSRSCDRISVQAGNPLTGFIYSYAFMQLNKKSIKNAVLNDKRYKAKFSALNTSQRARIESSLAAWAHNAGSGGLTTPLLTLLNSKYRGDKKVSDADQFLEELEQTMKTYGSGRRNSAARNREIREYFPRIKSTMAQIGQSTGGASCVR